MEELICIKSKARIYFGNLRIQKQFTLQIAIVKFAVVHKSHSSWGLKVIQIDSNISNCEDSKWSPTRLLFQQEFKLS